MTSIPINQWYESTFRIKVAADASLAPRALSRARRIASECLQRIQVCLHDVWLILKRYFANCLGEVKPQRMQKTKSTAAGLATASSTQQKDFALTMKLPQYRPHRRIRIALPPVLRPRTCFGRTTMIVSRHATERRLTLAP